MTEPLPATEIATRMTEAMRGLAEANTNYMRELMRANTALLTSFMEKTTDTLEEAPSECARHRRASEP